MGRESQIHEMNGVMSPDEVLDRCATHRIVTPFVRRYGWFFEPSDLPKRFRRARLGACFANSFLMAWDRA